MCTVCKVALCFGPCFSNNHKNWTKSKRDHNLVAPECLLIFLWLTYLHSPSLVSTLFLVDKMVFKVKERNSVILKKFDIGFEIIDPKQTRNNNFFYICLIHTIFYRHIGLAIMYFKFQNINFKFVTNFIKKNLGQTLIQIGLVLTFSTGHIVTDVSNFEIRPPNSKSAVPEIPEYQISFKTVWFLHFLSSTLDLPFQSNYLQIFCE